MVTGVVGEGVLAKVNNTSTHFLTSRDFRVEAYREMFVRITAFPNGCPDHPGAEIYIKRFLPWQDILIQIGKSARPACGPAMMIYDVHLHRVEGGFELADGESYLICSGERPNAWPGAFPCRRRAPNRSFGGGFNSVLVPADTTAQLRAMEKKREELSAVLGKKVLERARAVRAPPPEEVYGTFSKEHKQQPRLSRINPQSRSEPTLAGVGRLAVTDGFRR
jgi:hypothetical protein